MDTFEFWCPQRRPEGHNLALELGTPVTLFGPENLFNGTDRPVTKPNAWIASPEDAQPAVTLSWNAAQQIRKLVLVFDTDADHAMESVLMTHPETVMPFCVRNYSIEDSAGNVVYHKEGNFQTRNEILLSQPVVTKQLTIRMEHPSGNVPAALFAVRCYS